MKLSTRMLLLLLVAVVGVAVSSLSSFYILQKLKVNGPIYKEIVQGKDLAADILPPPEYVIESYLILQRLQDVSDGGKRDALIKEFDKLSKNYQERHEYWKRELPEGDIKKRLIEGTYPPALAFYKTTKDAYIPAILKGDTAAATRIMNSSLETSYVEHRNQIDKLVELLNKKLAAIETGAATSLKTYISAAIAINILILLSVIAIGLLISRTVQKQLGGDPAQVTRIADCVASGDLSMVIDTTGNKQDSLMVAMQKMVDNIKSLVAEVAILSKAAVDGDLATRADESKHRGEFKNIVAGFNETLDALIGPLKMAAEYVERISNGDIPAKITDDYHGDFNEIKVNLNNCIENVNALVADANLLAEAAVAGNLAARADVDRHQGEFRKVIIGVNLALDAQGRDWLKSGLNDLNALMRGDQTITEMAEKVLTFLAEFLKAGTGAFYMYDETSEALALAATYAYPPGKNPNDRFRLGEGLIGQAALEKKMISLSEIPPDYLQIGSALGESPPKDIVALPLMHNDQLVAAMELGTFGSFSNNEIEFLNQAREGIAIGFGVLRSRQRINELLEQTQQQTEELRVQQEELQQTNEELEERADMLEQQGKLIQAKNREIETASAQLRGKAADLERTSAYKSEFLANMSHELRTPLNSMMILSSLLTENREGNLTEKQREFAATINGAGKDLLNLINDILDLSKVEAGRLELLYEEVEVGSLCGSLEAVFRAQAEQKGLQYRIAVAEGVPKTVRLDEQRTLQILKNLLSNAFKFTEKGSVTLQVSAPASGANPLRAPALAFTVADTGIGIEKEKHDLVFQAFQQVDGSTSRKFGGTGLGLSISLQLARRMGGDIELRSERGKGSSFTLFLPLAGNGAAQQARSEGEPPRAGERQAQAGREAAAPAAAEPLPGAAPAVPAPPEPSAEPPLIAPVLPDDRGVLNKGDKCILIIEDDLNFARTLMAMVRDRGFGCIVAAEGNSGLRLADRYCPSAIILDVMLPGMDGWGVMRSLKDNPATRHIPVHFITCLDERQKGMAMGAVSFFTKPVSTEQLEEVFGTIERSVTRAMRRLLIVEDDPAEAASITALLQERNLEISAAATGREAIDLLGREQFDCIVLDIGLPDMSGFDLLEHIHRSEALRGIPVVIHTGRDLSHDEELKLQHYAKSIVVKGAKGPERLLNEVTLFLHMVESELPSEKRRMIREALDKEAMLEGKKVLLVDDDMRNVFALTSLLSAKNMIVIEAENGREALTRMEEQPDIDIVLMDIMMPEMDGYQAMRAIRLEPRFRDLPIVAMTAKAMAGDQEKCIEAGANDYIAKPIDADKLLSLLRVWLYRQG